MPRRHVLSVLSFLLCSNVFMFHQQYHNAAKIRLNCAWTCPNIPLKWLHETAFDPLSAIAVSILLKTFSWSNVHVRYWIRVHFKCLTSHALSDGALLTRYHGFFLPFHQSWSQLGVENILHLLYYIKHKFSITETQTCLTVCIKSFINEVYAFSISATNLTCSVNFSTMEKQFTISQSARNPLTISSAFTDSQNLRITWIH